MSDRICSVPGCTQPAAQRRFMCNGHCLRWQRKGDLGGKPVNATPEERFWFYVERGHDGTCWRWRGHTVNDGYGHMGITVDGQTKMVLTHRFAYELMVGPIPDGMVLDHLCRVRGCCNPKHLEPVPAAVNTLRGFGAPARNARKTHCPQGHPYDGVNYRGSRTCSICLREQSRRSERKRRKRQESA